MTVKEIGSLPCLDGGPYFAVAEIARKNHGSKWTAEFLVAAELSRRGYTVAFTQGSHTPGYDPIVASPSGEAFTIDVKGMAKRAGFGWYPTRRRAKDYFISLRSCRLEV